MKCFLLVVVLFATFSSAVNYLCGWNGLLNNLGPEQRCHDKVTGVTDILLHTFMNRGDTASETDSDELQFCWWTEGDTSIPLLEGNIEWFDAAPTGSGSTGWKAAHFHVATGYDNVWYYTTGTRKSGFTNIYHRLVSSHINACGCDEEGEGTNLTKDCYHYCTSFKDVVAAGTGAVMDGWGNVSDLVGRVGHTRVRVWIRRRSGQSNTMNVCYDTNDLVGTATGNWSFFGCYQRLGTATRENSGQEDESFEDPPVGDRSWDLSRTSWNNNGGTGDSTWK